MTHTFNKALISTLTAAGLCLAAAPAFAGPGSPTQVSCGGATLTVVGAPGNGGNNWGAVQIQGGGHLVLESLEYAVHDDTAGITLDDEVIAHGAAHQNQAGVDCLVASETATLGDVAPEGFAYPPGTAPTDRVTSSLRAVVVPRP